LLKYRKRYQSMGSKSQIRG